MKWRFVILGLILVAALLGVFALSGGITGFAVGTPVCKDVQEQYQTLQPYQEQRDAQVPLQYKVISSQEEVTGGRKVLTVKVQNTDTIEGAFTLHTKTAGQQIEKVESVLPGEIKIFSQSYAPDENIEYVIVPSKKTVADTVTKYKKVTAQRMVRKCG